MKKLFLIAAALLLLVLFPGLAAALAGAVVVLSEQPALVGFALGLAAWPHLRGTKTRTPKH
ncbi:hypothetical protein [Streptomyces sp. NBC_01716]|uniref:hypothetical protein n=1 Tax=Streptomyces sp. NBC_01716 TaxID=2975917 RepID=UPI002E3131EA|nr:hypothetical protein [Streptomyces sp. NBC_01716]